MRHEMLNIVWERAENTLEAISIGNNFHNKTQVVQQLRERIDKWDHMKLKSFCTTTTKKSSLYCTGCPQNGRKSLLAVHLTKD
jgi:hypothetical protein